MSLIIAKNKVNAEQLMGVETPEAADRFQPIPHFSLVEMTRDAITRAGLEVSLEYIHSLAEVNATSAALLSRARTSTGLTAKSCLVFATLTTSLSPLRCALEIA